jgi:hypothetical protein
MTSIVFAPKRAAGAENRLAPAMQKAIDSAAARLAVKLEAANTKTYHNAMKGTAKAFGQKAPKSITDKDALAAIKARAKVSAASIVNTQATRMAALVAQHGTRADATPFFKEWESGQKARIAHYESAMTMSAAQDDFQTKNKLDGTERAIPLDAQCISCQDAVSAGAVPIGTLPDMPLHLNCVHSVVQTYTMPADPSTLWFGA